MFGLFIALGKINSQLTEEEILEFWPSRSASKIISVSPYITLARFTPGQHNPSSCYVTSEDENRIILADGYMIVDSGAPVSGLQAHLRKLAEITSGINVKSGLASIVAGSYNLVLVDKAGSRCYVVTDPIGALPLYYSRVDGGWLISSNPVALAASGLIDTSIDRTACAEWALFSHTIGDRYPVEGIRVFPPGSLFTWSLENPEGRLENYERIWDYLPQARPPGVDQLAEAFVASCSRIQLVDPKPAILQSSGMDSRLITASLPGKATPPCYTYGNPDAHEIRIARIVAETRGSQWNHTWQHGDIVTEELDSIFNDSGVIMWPDRNFAARKMAEDGVSGVLDGLAGDALLGGSLYSHDHHFGLHNQIFRLLCHLKDQPYSQISFDEITEELYQHFTQVPISYFRNVANDDFIDLICKEKQNILADIRQQLEFVKPANDSLALLWRNLIFANRVPHMTVQQGEMCRRYVDIYYPFTNDRSFLKLALSIPPEAAAYRRLYIKLYRKRYPQYAKIPYGGTLIPIRRHVLNHKLSAILVSMNITIPVLTGSAKGKQRDPNGWGIWLAESRMLRDYVIENLRQGGIIDEKRAADHMDKIALGQVMGAGKLFHLTSIAKWISLSDA